MTIAVLGAGAFGTSLALALSRDGAEVILYARDPDVAKLMQDSRKTHARLPGHDLPESLHVTSELPEVEIALIAVPMQKMRAFLAEKQPVAGALVACCKGVDRQTGLGAVATIEAGSGAKAALLTGPSFAVDIAKGLPTALTLAAREQETATHLQSALTRPALRLYRSTDVIGAELGGALKNVVALAAGMAMGAGLGDSARASVIARGFAELTRYASAKGAKAETLQGLSGLGDLVLTCTSEKSRNFVAGQTLGAGRALDPNITVEGAATAGAVARDADAMKIDMPITRAVAEVVGGELNVQGAIEALLARPAGAE